MTLLAWGLVALTVVAAASTAVLSRGDTARQAGSVGAVLGVLPGVGGLLIGFGGFVPVPFDRSVWPPLVVLTCLALAGALLLCLPAPQPASPPAADGPPSAPPARVRIPRPRARHARRAVRRHTADV